MLFVIYGHKLYSHTHSYIHYGFLKAFKQLGWDTEWIDETDNRDADSFPEGTVFLTEGQVDNKLPRRSDCFYILHNIPPERYSDIPESNKIMLEVYTRKQVRSGINISDVSVYTPEDNRLYTIWATDLLPDEIDIDCAIERYDDKKKAVIFIGSMNNCAQFGNQQQIIPYVQEAHNDGYEWIQHTSPFSHPVDNNTQQQLISSCELAPAIVGHWQQEQGYIPCRIFKSISYGCIGITNSQYVYELLGGQCIFDKDSRLLYQKTKAFLSQPREVIKESLRKQMQLVKDNHTYINRVNDILKMFRDIKRVM